ncbi:MAG TPA: type II toxin-antitoxin system PemK/MazF family toxin [Candidatus Polarisedimenticolia bacterium]|nr:type II toxin-antitoxin system PemK/MazF family toxin [Candidatus Polarisedimenticolia bacterium]
MVQANDLDTGLPQTVIVLITSNIARKDHPSRVFIPLASSQAKGAGLLTDSIIMADNLATVLDKAIVNRLGQLADMKTVDATLRVTLAL